MSFLGSGKTSLEKGDFSKDLKNVRKSHVDNLGKSFQEEKKANTKFMKSLHDMSEK